MDDKMIFGLSNFMESDKFDVFISGMKTTFFVCYKNELLPVFFNI